tara:strand:+ start:6462 stop:6698 length:237 start_codon:yes stop_codon:yes gene_type:complete
MFNPLVDDFSKLSDTVLEEKIVELGRKYWQTRNPQVQMQISSILEMYKDEARVRRAIAYQRQNENNDNNGLDSLINVS